MARRGRGLAGVAYTKKDLKEQAKSCGLYFFSPKSMRFFKSRLIAVYPSKKRDATYFVMGQGGESRGVFSTIPRHYVVGVFKGCQVSTIGHGSLNYKSYSSSAKAKKVAAAIARKADTGEAQLKRRRRRKR